MSYKTHIGKKRKYLDGALHTTLLDDCYDIIDVREEEMFDITIVTETNEYTTISIFWDIEQDNPHLLNCSRLGSVLSRYSGNTFRENTKDQGNMYIVGNGRKGNGLVGTYEMTTYNGVSREIKDIINTAELYYRENGLGYVVDEMINKKFIKRRSQ